MRSLGPRLISAILYLGLAAGFAAAAPQPGLRINGQLWIPLGNDSGVSDTNGNPLQLYSIGYGADVNADLALWGFASPYLDLGGGLIPANTSAGGTVSNLTFGQAGAGLALYAYPIPRLMLRLGGSGGFSYVSYTPESQSGSSSGNSAVSGLAPYWKAKGELGFRLSPSITASLYGGYQQILGASSAIYKGIAGGLAVSFSLGGSEGNVGQKVQSQETIFPIQFYKYDKVALAKVILKNSEPAEIQDVEVSFSAGSYTSRAAICYQASNFQRGDQVEIPVYAAFNDSVLGFTESTRIQGELKVRYKLLGAPKESSSAISIVFNGRNAASWKDARVVGAFVAPQDPAMLELSKYIAGLVRIRSRSEVDKNLQYGMGLFEGLRVYGLVQTPDPSMPYTVAHASPSNTAYIQYPYQTLSYKSGDSDAIAITVAEALESVAVPSAILALPEDVIVAFPLDMNESRVRTSFSSLQDLVFQDGKAWVPLRASMIRDGFLRAWKEGAALYEKHAAEGLKIVPVEEDWKEYQAVALPNVDYKPTKPEEDAVNLAFDNVLGRFVAAEVEPRVKRLTEEMKGAGNGRQYNSLGIVYAQYGMYDEAKKAFTQAVTLGYSASMVNLANVAFLMKDFDTAASYFQKALDLQPDNKAAKIGLARAKYELDDFSQADDLFSQVKLLDPKLADQYSYLASRVDEGNGVQRASASAADHGSVNWDAAGEK